MLAKIAVTRNKIALSKRKFSLTWLLVLCGHSIATKFRNDVSSRGLRCPEYIQLFSQKSKVFRPSWILFDSSAYTRKQIFAENNTYMLSEKRQVILDISWKEEFIREVRGFSIISFGFLGDLLSKFEFQGKKVFLRR